VNGNIRVLLADDHPVVREGLRTMLRDEPGIEVVGDAPNAEGAIQMAEELKPQVVLMDLRMPGIGGIEATQRIKKAHPTIAVIMLTMYDGEVYVIEAIRCGAAGYLVKDASKDLICDAIRSVVDGGTLIRSGLLRQAFQMALPMARAGEHANERESSTAGRLTRREMEVLRMVAQGHGNKAIAAQLGLAEVTVKKNVQAILGKLGVSDRTQAAIMGIRLGLVE